MNNKETVLVTGGTGFVGIQTILQLLQQGYNVHTTLRSLIRNDEIINALQAEGITNFEQLRFFEADLTSDTGWDEAVKGCTYVLHVASPFPLVEPEDENELIIPARDGALRVLKAAKKAGVKRVVLTSSFAAVGFSISPKDHLFTEEDWTDENAPIQPYIKSKTIAERAAWNFIKESGGDLELTVINPVGIFGPIIGGIIPASYDGAIKAIINGTVTESPDFTFAVVDVRDVAQIHIQAMLHPKANGERFIAASDGAVSFYDIAQIIKNERTEKAGLIADLKPVGEDFYVHISNQKAKDFFNWNPISKEEAILASVDTGDKGAIKLPKVLSDLIQAQNNFDSAAYANCFSEKAIVFDEGKTYNGRAEIYQWIQNANEKYKTVMKPIEYSAIDQILKTEVSGNFDSSPVVLNYQFKIANNLVASLKVTS